MGYPGRHNIYNATIRRMVQEALEAQEQAFRQEHENDTDQQLLAYVRANAFRLNHTPWPGEIPGGSYIEERFGSWSVAVARAKLPAPRTANQQKNFARYNAEVEHQKEVYRQRIAVMPPLLGTEAALQENNRLRAVQIETRLTLWQMRDPEPWQWRRILILLNKGIRCKTGTRRFDRCAVSTESVSFVTKVSHWVHT